MSLLLNRCCSEFKYALHSSLIGPDDFAEEAISPNPDEDEECWFMPKGHGKIRNLVFKCFKDYDEHLKHI